MPYIDKRYGQNKAGDSMSCNRKIVRNAILKLDNPSKYDGVIKYYLGGMSQGNTAVLINNDAG